MYLDEDCYFVIDKFKNWGKKEITWKCTGGLEQKQSRSIRSCGQHRRDKYLRYRELCVSTTVLKLTKALGQETKPDVLLHFQHFFQLLTKRVSEKL